MIDGRGRVGGRTKVGRRVEVELWLGLGLGLVICLRRSVSLLLNYLRELLKLSRVVLDCGKRMLMSVVEYEGHMEMVGSLWERDLSESMVVHCSDLGTWCSLRWGQKMSTPGRRAKDCFLVRYLPAARRNRLMTGSMWAVVRMNE